MEKKYSFLNNLVGWLVLLFSSYVFIATIEPTASFWDCGEFIASATKLQVGHPPGAPLWMIIARIFGLFASEVDGIAAADNVFSALCSSLSILFLFWSITALAKKISLQTGELTKGKIAVILSSGIIGAVAYTFSDSFWFSAVEAEVYAASSLFTALVFWLTLKWEANANKKYADRYLILVAYFMGLSIGVHILNLLALPALVYIYYFKRFKPSTTGFILAGIISIVMLGIVQQGIISWNRGSLELENGSKILAASTSASAVRGMSFNILFLDEFAFVPNHIAESFFASVYPTITSGKNTKVIMVSTPHGMNHFYRYWHDAERGKNEYIPTDVHWSEVPGRDDVWKEQTIANTSEQQFKVEFECEFLGSINTLIAPSILRNMVYDAPITRNAGLDIYEKPEKDHNYIVTVDVARGLGNDYSAFIVFDVTQFPYKVIAKYRNNEIKPMLFPNVILDVAKGYNNAYVLVEVNDIGDQVASILQYDLEYENILMASMRGRNGQIVGQGFSGKKTQLGVRTTAAVKKLGCSNLKTLIEDHKLITCDYEVISELTTFAQKHNSFEAEEGCNDDLAMCLVIFAWLVQQEYFKEMTDNDIRKRIYEEQKNQIEQDMAPFGFIETGLEDSQFVDKDGEVWHTDEYGDRSYMWDYR